MIVFGHSINGPLLVVVQPHCNHFLAGPGCCCLVVVLIGVVVSDLANPRKCHIIEIDLLLLHFKEASYRELEVIGLVVVYVVLKLVILPQFQKSVRNCQLDVSWVGECLQSSVGEDAFVADCY